MKIVILKAYFKIILSIIIDFKLLLSIDNHNEKLIDSSSQIYSNESSQSSSSTSLYNMPYSPLNLENESQEEYEIIEQNQPKVLFDDFIIKNITTFAFSRNTKYNIFWSLN